MGNSKCCGKNAPKAAEIPTESKNKNTGVPISQREDYQEPLIEEYYDNKDGTREPDR